MSRHLALCHCTRMPGVACTMDATQEDFLCNVCRDGCYSIAQNGGDGIAAHRSLRHIVEPALTWDVAVHPELPPDAAELAQQWGLLTGRD